MSHVQSYILLISVDEEKAIGFAKDAAIGRFIQSMFPLNVLIES